MGKTEKGGLGEKPLVALNWTKPAILLTFCLEEAARKGRL